MRPAALFFAFFPLSLAACASSAPPACPAPAAPSVSPYARVVPPPSAVPPPATAVSSARAPSACDVWQREESFSKSVRDHDAAAFAEHIHPGAVFLNGDGSVLRGRDAVVAAWGDLVRGEVTKLEWHPTSVLLTGDPHVALSRGPAWAAVAKPGEPVRWVKGTFQSTWVMDDDGTWRVAIDGGTPRPTPATEAEIAALKAQIPPTCTESK